MPERDPSMTEPTRTVGQPPAVSTVPYGLPSWQRVAAILVGLLAVWLFLRLFAGHEHITIRVFLDLL